MEHIYRESHQSREEASLSMFGYIGIYRTVLQDYKSYGRPAYLGYKNPMEYEKNNEES